MNLLGRAFLGALIGALLFIAIHPLTRAWLLDSFTSTSTLEDALVQSALIPSDPLPKPNEPKAAALWCEIFASKVLGGKNLDKKEIASVRQVATLMSKNDADNALWMQVLSIVQWQEGATQDSIKTWKRSAGYRRWSDYQTPRLNLASSLIFRGRYQQMAWIYGWLYTQRTKALSTLVRRHSSLLLDYSEAQPVAQKLQIKFASLINGSLIRDGAQSVATGKIGAIMVEESCHPAKLRKATTPAKLITAQYDFIGEMRKVGLGSEALEAERIFGDNDGWLALIPSAQEASEFQSLARESVILSAVPGGMILATLFGGVLWFIGAVMLRVDVIYTAHRQTILVAVGVLFAGLSYFISKDPMTALVVASAFAFCLLNPKNLRKARLSDLGPMYSFVRLIFIPLTSCLFWMYGVSMHPGYGLYVERFPWEFNSLIAASPNLICLTVALFISVGPLWAFAKRIPSLWVLGLGLRWVGRVIFLGNILLVSVYIPFAVGQNRYLQKQLSQMMQNEPIHYIKSVQ